MNLDISKMSDMVNNYPRKLFGYRSPYQCSEELLNKKVLGLNRLRQVPANKVKFKYFKK